MLFINDPADEITSIAIDKELVKADEQTFTILHCSYLVMSEYHDDWRVHIHKTSYLSSHHDEVLPLLHAINIPVANQWHFFEKVEECLNFTLIFPKVPTNWSGFNFIEEENNCTCAGFKVWNIKKNASGIFRLQFR